MPTKSFISLLSLIVLKLNLCLIFAQVKHHHHLEGKIVRSVDMEDGLGLIGIKGEKAGEGVLYLKSKKSDQWLILNGGNALSDSVEDVQSVEIIDDSCFLAGTWKNGLYRTIDRGKSWSRVNNFKALDVRSIKKAPSNTNYIYAATVQQGFMLSLDKGATWERMSDAVDSKLLPSWSISVDPKDHLTVYAMTFQNGIMKTQDGGKTWKSILKSDNVMYMSLDMNGKEIWACGSGETKNALSHSSDEGKTWKQEDMESCGALNSIAVTKKGLILGTWDQGAIVYKPKNHVHQEIEKVDSDAISHIYEFKKELYIFTWGNGLYHLKTNDIYKKHVRVNF